MSKQSIKQELIDYINANTDENWAWNYPIDYIAEQVEERGIESLDSIDFTDDLTDYDWLNGLLEDTDGKAQDYHGDLIDFAAARNLMDEEICETIEDTEDASDFIMQYAALHEKKHGEKFAPYHGLAW